MIHLFVYVPESHADAVKAAMFAAGAGRTQRYEQCAWQQRGLGQFKPMKGSEPYLGEVGMLAVVTEIKIEMMCSDSAAEQVIAAMKAVHPYEEPAYGALSLLRI